MKRQIYFFLLAALGVVTFLGSCKRYLTLEPQSTFDENYVFSTVENARAAVLGAYNMLAGDNAYGSRLSMMYPYDTDEMIGVTNTTAPDNSSRSLSRYDLNPTNAQLELPFERLYKGVERANVCIKFIPLMEGYTKGSATEQKELKRLYGEALTLRAQFYLEIIRNWGDVPAPFVPSIDLSTTFLPKTDRDSIYDHLLNDLKVAAEIVPWRTEVAPDERITKGAVKGLRARMALYRGGYSLRRGSNQMERRSDYLTYYKIARDECSEIMQRRDQHTLNQSFEAVFKDNIDAHQLEPNGEVLFEVAMGGANGEADGKIGYYDGPRFYVSGGGRQLGNSSVRVVPVYFYAFDSLDTRRDVTTAPYYNNANGTKAVQTLLNMTSGKFRSDWISNPVPSSAVQYLGINWPLIRFSDILLMFAEAENELNNGPTAEAKAAYEEVRKRGFKGNESQIGTTPSTKETFFDAIVNERFFEFGGEGIRKYDLIRWNLLGAKIAEARDIYSKMLNKIAPYDKLPQSMYYKTGSTTVIYANSLYQPSPTATPAGYTKVAWISSITPAFITNLAQLFQPNHNELLPIPEQSIQANPNLTQDYGY